ncbi:Pre-rRNA-processing protein esf1, partial [Diplonema papillatum]
DSRGFRLEEGEVKQRDLTSKAAPKTLQGYYKQLRKDAGQDVDGDEKEDAAEEEEEEEDAEEAAASAMSDSDVEDDESLGSDVYNDVRGEDAETDEATRRLALRNCDWDNLNASHLYALFQSFTPRGGALVGVQIFVSEYGKQQLAHESRHGPSLWVKPLDGDDYALAQEGIDNSGDEAGNSGLGELQKVDDESASEGDDPYAFEEEDEAVRTAVGEDGELFSENKYRRYELQRLKYYYAIVTFDSKATAAHVYKECDGTEIERSGTVFDLSFVPDEMVFDEEPREECDQLQAGFNANTAFVTNALQNSRFAISWDQADPKRRKSFASTFVADDEELDDLEAYLAPCESSEEEAEGQRQDDKVKAIRNKYACLFEGVGGLTENLPDAHSAGEAEEGEEEGSESQGEARGIEAVWSDDDDDEISADDAELVKQQLADLTSDDEGASADLDGEVTGDLEGTLHLGAKEGGKDLKDALYAKQNRDGETVWEKRQRKKREGRKQAKKQLKDQRRAGGGPADGGEEVEVASKQKLREVMGGLLDEDSGGDGSGGDDDEDHEGRPARRKRTTKKEKRKLQKSRKVAAGAEEREAKRQQRMRAVLATVANDRTPAAQQKQQQQQEQERQEAPPVSRAAARAAARFTKLADSRFAVDPSHPQLSKANDAKEVLDVVRAARKRKLAAPPQAAAAAAVAAADSVGSDVLSRVDYFKQKAKLQKTA